MKNSIKLTAILCALGLLLTGCEGTFNIEYRSEEAYVDEYYEIKDDSSVQEVKNYQGMKNALMNLINSAAEYGIIKTEKYSGAAEEDISKACFEVTRETPMGVYAVDYITHSANLIVSYYEIEVYITYKRTAEEIESVVTIHSGNELQELLNKALENFDTSLSVMQVSTDIDRETIEGYVEASYRANPQLIPLCPAVRVNTYASPESTIQKITEVELLYSVDTDELLRRLEQLDSRVREILDPNGLNDIEYICGRVLEICRPARIAAGSTAYEALAGSGWADSEGYAMAVKLLCAAAGLDCHVVEGRLNNEEYYWNIVAVGGEYRHVDVYAADVWGGDIDLLTDEDMPESYYWDAGAYPACERADAETLAGESVEVINT